MRRSTHGNSARSPHKQTQPPFLGKQAKSPKKAGGFCAQTRRLRLKQPLNPRNELFGNRIEKHGNETTRQKSQDQTQHKMSSCFFYVCPFVYYIIIFLFAQVFFRKNTKKFCARRRVEFAGLRT
jgi:hypothetical protein